MPDMEKLPHSAAPQCQVRMERDDNHVAGVGKINLFWIRLLIPKEAIVRTGVTLMIPTKTDAGWILPRR